ncbi:toxin-antitoxin system HicB family antitoxin [Streptomyces sp. NPDC087440]|uniref:toxin-antitoxin system HicB family antitoxin n=1 Tax=Streptomyces sp. NPDC087440 TaxID=3365790 RepID=UPI0037F98E8B
MDLSPYVDTLRRELAVAAEAGGEDARVLAERLTAPLESAARLALLNVLSDAMGEVTRELAPGSVDVRLRGLDPSFVVTPAPGGPDFGWQPEQTAPATSVAPPLPPDTDDGGTARINLRLPTHLKTRAEEAATREGLSLNAWLVRAVGAAVDPGPAAARSPQDPGTGRGRQSFTGWVR